ncbi:MAG: ribokinase [Clostridia bacterium]|nr:ribokinase [Clostridia bacterium]
MKALVFGSLNIDRTYRVSHLVRPGETISAQSMESFCGGKGFNQAVALRRAGLETAFSGAVGQDGGMLLDALDKNGIDRENVLRLTQSTGHAIIEVDENGQNSILILAGTNGLISRERIAQVLSGCARGDLLVAQNEISNVDFLLGEAAAKGLVIAFNPSPFNEKIAACDLAAVDYLLINETEGRELTGEEEPGRILDALCGRYPKMNVVLTLGENGSVYRDREGKTVQAGIYPVQTVDTTAAGDTFTGFFLEAVCRGQSASAALKRASVAAGIAVSRKGAEPSIPTAREVDQALRALEKEGAAP